MHRLKMLIAVIAFASPATALAVSPLYTYIEGGYAHGDPDGASSMDGFSIGGSFAFDERFHGLAEYTDVRSSPWKSRQTRIAAGYNHAVTSGSDLVARIGFAHDDHRFGSDSGWMAQVGMRSMVTDVFELDGFITHLNTASGETGIQFGGRYYLSYSWSLGADLELFDDFTRFRALVRFSF